VSTFQRQADEFVDLLTRAGRAGVIDAHGHLHSPDDGRFVEMGGGLDPLGLAARVSKLRLATADTFEGSARHDGRDGALVAAVIQEKGAGRVAMLSTVKTPRSRRLPDPIPATTIPTTRRRRPSWLRGAPRNWPSSMPRLSVI